MANLIETLGAIAIISALIAGLAYIQSRSGEEKRARYLARMRRFATLALICCAVAAVLEVVTRFS